MSQRLPVLFIGHGSPMNAIAENSYTKKLNELGKTLPRPSAILVVSAHWMTEGSWVTGMEKPNTIHDFYGFPQALFDVQYPAPGSPRIANLISDVILNPKVTVDKEMWGLDHGTWSVLRHLYPKADIPVLQLSLHMEQPAEYHYKLGQQLAQFRNQAVLIIGSGNVVHNLRQIKWEDEAAPYPWAQEFDQWLKDKITKRDFETIMREFRSSDAGKLSVPTMEHFYPLFYILGASNNSDSLKFEYEEIQNGSISMLSLSFS